MTHPRTTIRDAVANILTGLPTTGARVFPSRMVEYDPKAEGGAGLMVYTVRETSAPDTLGRNRGSMRELQLVVEAVAQVNETLDDTLDEIAREIEAAMLADFTLSGTAKDHWLSETAIVMRGGEAAEKQTGGVVLTYTVIYRALAADFADDGIVEAAGAAAGTAAASGVAPDLVEASLDFSLASNSMYLALLEDI